MAGGKLEVLTALDSAKTQLYHFTALVIAGMGFFTDAFDLFCISLVTKLLGRIYYTVEGAKVPGTLPPNVSVAVNGVAFCGTLAGQLFFGWVGDKMGRKSVYGLTLMLMVVCAIASGLSVGHSPKGVMATLCFFRFWLGFGIGGDYPLSATIMSEYANKRTRGAFIAAVFAMQGFGNLTGGIVALIVSSAFNNAFKAVPYDVDAARSLPSQADFPCKAKVYLPRNIGCIWKGRSYCRCLRILVCCLKHEPCRYRRRIPTGYWNKELTTHARRHQFLGNVVYLVGSRIKRKIA